MCIVFWIVKLVKCPILSNHNSQTLFENLLWLLTVVFFESLKNVLCKGLIPDLIRIVYKSSQLLWQRSRNGSGPSIVVPKSSPGRFRVSSVFLVTRPLDLNLNPFEDTEWGRKELGRSHKGIYNIILTRCTSYFKEGLICKNNYMVFILSEILVSLHLSSGSWW